MAHYKGAASEATRAMNIMKRRERAREELEERKKKVESDVKVMETHGEAFVKKVATHTDAIEASTVGLVTLDQLRKKQENKARENQLAQVQSTKLDQKRVEPSCKNLREKPTKTLSFGYDDDNEDPREAKKLKLSDLDMDTTFLPDREREEEERRLREQLAMEWREKQEQLKEEEIEITFSFWDGSGHRRMVRLKKGNSIYQFLQACLETLRKDFKELRTVSADQLMYVKEDLIIPHHYTFYDFIVTKARGKSGPLFTFDVHDDIRLTVDATIEKDESHAGKVLLRSWYERNKHIFPASRWEPYDPTKTYEKYTISDKKSK